MRSFAWLSVVLLGACGPSAGNYPDSGNGGPGRDGGGGGGSGEFADAAPAEACDKMDILFVIDDSGSMSEEQRNLATNFPQFVSVINDYMTENGSLLDYRIAVTTTGRDIDYTITLVPGVPIDFHEMGDEGEFKAGCSLARSWVERNDADPSEVVSCRANVGTAGPSYEMPLLMAEWALSLRVSDGTNPSDFLREEALLAIVLLTDEDDCSREDNNFDVGLTTDVCDSALPEIQPLSRFLSFFDALKGERGRWATAVIAGPTDCTSSFGDAIEAVRLKEFVAQTGNNAVFSNICDGDLTGALSDALNTFESACESFPPIP